jgi:hypothetical protein
MARNVKRYSSDILFGSKLWLLPNYGNASKFPYLKDFNTVKIHLIRNHLNRKKGKQKPLN